MRLALLTATIVFAGTLASHAATVRAVDHPRCDYRLEGKIAQGDAAQVDAIPGTHDGLTLCLDSPGGSLAEGRRIFDAIWTGNIHTRVLGGDTCESACALAFLGGSINTGTANIRFQSRVIEPGARLGFHAPSLGLTGDRAYPAELVNKAFETALKSAEDIFAINLHEEHNVVAMNDFLYQRIITTRPESMYYIATVGDAVMANIDLSGVELPVTPKLINLVAMCDNYWAANEQAARPDYRSASEYFAEIRRGIYGTRNPREAKLSGMFAAKVGDYYWAAKFYEKACLATVDEDFRRNELSDSTRIRIYSVRSGSDFGPGTDYDTAEQDVSVPRWYMLDPDTPIAAFAPGANASDRTTQDDFVKMAGFDLFGGDLPDGMLRPASAEACVQACIGRGGCDAVTWDRWNKICYLKSVEWTRKTLYVLSKATTFVKAPQDQKLFRARKGVIRNRFRDDKGFRDSPYETRTRDNKRSCERACFTHDCLGYNWTARTRTCELFAEPDEYFDALGVTAGFKQQDVLD